MITLLDELQQLCEGVRTKRTPKRIITAANALVDEHQARYQAYTATITTSTGHPTSAQATC